MNKAIVFLAIATIMLVGIQSHEVGVYKDGGDWGTGDSLENYNNATKEVLELINEIKNDPSTLLQPKIIIYLVVTTLLAIVVVTMVGYELYQDFKREKSK